MGVNEQRIEEIARDTVPTDKNDRVKLGLLKSVAVVDELDEELNGWLSFHDVRVYDDNIVGIVADWKWTIERWVSGDMDERMRSLGWTVFAHTLADRDKDDHEAEFRFVKQYGEVKVYLNVYVEFTRRVFEALSSGEDITPDEDDEGSATLEEVRDAIQKNRMKEELDDG